MYTITPVSGCHVTAPHVLLWDHLPTIS